MTSGKNIVITLLKGAGFDVTDLGVDVPVSRFVDDLARKENKREWKMHSWHVRLA